ncbi:hypothetical protein FEM41_20230 [Jejubacter calystegiae]|uniref:Ead/Ea22-like family protein n=1 Tax=Jejubacter calystegiae TaxID=2579935 RepID=A0A4P8YLV7_9ENTR|nr:hypothetical protein [Jejubacter calystegiae]QCT21815.1 hypothetical protein FEM41_20230 [Jejubacter calystegiae]
MSELSVKELIKKLTAAAHDEIKCRENGDTSDDWQDEASPENLLRVLAYVAELEREKLAMEAAALAMRDDMRKARNELESRRVRVELPEIRSVERMSDITHNEAVSKCRHAFVSACREAGIECEVV